jgi:ribosomal protein L36
LYTNLTSSHILWCAFIKRKNNLYIIGFQTDERRKIYGVRKPIFTDATGWYVCIYIYTYQYLSTHVDDWCWSIYYIWHHIKKYNRKIHLNKQKLRLTDCVFIVTIFHAEKWCDKSQHVNNWLNIWTIFACVKGKNKVLVICDVWWRLSYQSHKFMRHLLYYMFRSINNHDLMFYLHLTNEESQNITWF